MNKAREVRIPELVAEVLARVEAGERADRALRFVLRANAWLSSVDRASVAQWSLGLCVWRGRVEQLAQGRKECFLPLYLLEQQGFTLEDAAALGGVEPSLLRLQLEEAPVFHDPVEALAFRRSLPRWLAARWCEIFGPERADRLADAMNVPGPVSIRTNELLNSREELARRLEEEGVRTHLLRHVDSGLRIEGRVNITGLEAWREGRFEVQDEGSQFISEAVNARPAELVVDLCAGAGGKTLALASAMRNEGRLVAIEPNPERIPDLRGRLSRAGVDCVEIRMGDGADEALIEDLLSCADAVLVDAPCSELGTLRRSPDARWRIAPEAPAQWAPLQRRLLASAARLLRPGGRLVYATCSIDSVENEEVADSFQHPEFVRTLTRSLAPDTDGTDGFFVSAWQRKIG